MIYELWDTTTLNLVGSFESEVEALAVVHGAVTRYGAGYVDGLVLVRENARGESCTLAEGLGLLELTAADPLTLEIAVP